MLKNINIYPIAFCLLMGKGLFLSFDWQMVSIVALILAFKGVKAFIETQKRPDLAEDILSRVKSMETRLNLSNRNPK